MTYSESKAGGNELQDREGDQGLLLSSVMFLSGSRLQSVPRSLGLKFGWHCIALGEK
jgi:hypothetical protein